MIAHREQKDISLASLRMLIVTDGANPCMCALTFMYYDNGNRAFLKDNSSILPCLISLGDFACSSCYKAADLSVVSNS